MLSQDDEVVALKLSMLERCLPATSAVVYGDVWLVEGRYAVACVERGCERVLLVDALETPGWQETRLRHPQIDFLKGDFANPLFMTSFRGLFDVGVAFDVLLHQPAMLGTLHLLLEKVGRRFCVVQPMLEEQAASGSLVYLPGNAAASELYPLAAPSAEVRVFDPLEVNHAHWIWAMTASFLTAAMKGEGFELVVEESGEPLPNPRWIWWGGVFERVSETPAGHWCSYHTTPGLWLEPW